MQRGWVHQHQPFDPILVFQSELGHRGPAHGVPNQRESFQFQSIDRIKEVYGEGLD